MEKIPSPISAKPSWEIIKELHRLSDEELRAKLRNCSRLELGNIEAASYIAADSTGSDGGLHNSRANAKRAGMPLTDFDHEIARIWDAIEDVRQEQSAPKKQ